MEEKILKIFIENQIFSSNQDIEEMLDCFDIFHLYQDWLFYRLNKNSIQRGLIDKQQLLICNNTDGMVCLIKLFEGHKPLTKVETMDWVEETDFLIHLNNNSLPLLIEEFEKLDTNDHSNDHNDQSNDSISF